MLVKISEAERKLGVSRETILKRIHSGEWPFYRLGEKAIRVDCEEIIRITRQSNVNVSKRSNANDER